MEKIVKIVFNVVRISLGLVFVFSGFVKGIDLLGSAYKFNDYFTAAGLPHNDGIAMVMSFLLSGAEFLIGVALITGIFFNLTAWTAISFMAFFTILTFILAIFNPVTDCGCFGDAIKLTNWETFYKNVVFSALVIFIFYRRKKFNCLMPSLAQWVILVTIIASFSIISIYSYRHLPIIDFMPYSIGADIREKTKIPANAPKDEYETRLLYKNLKTGKVEEFTMENYPWQDTLNWKWADTKSILTKKGYTPPIHDFEITSSNGSNITDSILNDSSYVFLFIAYNINKSNKDALVKAERIYSYCQSTGKCKFYAISATASSEIENLRKNNPFSYSFCSADETAMKSVIRSNPGLVLLKKGTVIGKWHYNDFDKVTFKTDNLQTISLEQTRKRAENGISYAFIFALAALISIIWALSMYFKK